MQTATTVHFPQAGQDNTEATLHIAKARADELGINTIIVATTRGSTGVRAAEVFAGRRLIVVTHFTGYKEPNSQELLPEHRERIQALGGVILTSTSPFIAIGRALRRKHQTMALEDIIANSLRIVGIGIKVVCEVACMAADAGLARTDEEAIAISGTGRGADTAVVLRPVNSFDFFDLRISEILCRPRLK
ncbi:MAG: hypothetical protein HYU86_06255 [Chloroflexi bacterium]|nr:hypothetical protein [Chloroflexota bacterium]